MKEKKKENYQHTIYACYIGYITQAIVNNLAPLLFLLFRRDFHIGLDQITLLTTVNFLVQLLVDLASVKFVDKIGYRASAVLAHVMAMFGLLGLAVFPRFLGSSYVGLLLAVICYAIGGGLTEVIISPIVEACPTEKKEAAMSLLHSFYCWGQVLVVALTTVFFHVFGTDKWYLLAALWSIVPFLNIFYFLQVPIYPIVAEHEGLPLRELFRQKIFWVLMLLMVCAGASELGMSQWASAFAESALHVSKTVGDLAGPCAFAVLMGTARAVFGKYSDYLPLKTAMGVCAVLCTGCYLLAALAASPVFALVGCAVCGLSVGIFWPGTFSMAAKTIPGGGTAMFALMALAGDLGCSSGPTVIGFVAEAGTGLKSALLAAVVFPVLLLVGLMLLGGKKGESIVGD
ncbi:MAG: MFS transporter [Lachnospiraceae bacterium]|nr:MFS transporter [Lachnospiraceae bacterium]